MFYNLPSWFVNWDKNKMIKVYGCSFMYLDSVGTVPIRSDKYNNQFISVHSNIIRDDSIFLSSYYEEPEMYHKYVQNSWVHQVKNKELYVGQYAWKSLNDTLEDDTVYDDYEQLLRTKSI
jgi:hypothetical protein